MAVNVTPLTYLSNCQILYSFRDTERKSMSTERTFGEINKPEDLISKCRELCEALAEDLAQAELKVKYGNIYLYTSSEDSCHLIN